MFWCWLWLLPLALQFIIFLCVFWIMMLGFSLQVHPHNGESTPSTINHVTLYNSILIQAQFTTIYTYIYKNLQNGNNNKAQSYDCRYTHLHLIFSKEPTLTSVPTKFLYDVYLFSKSKMQKKRLVMEKTKLNGGGIKFLAEEFQQAIPRRHQSFVVCHSC